MVNKKEVASFETTSDDYLFTDVSLSGHHPVLVNHRIISVDQLLDPLHKLWLGTISSSEICYDLLLRVPLHLQRADRLLNVLFRRCSRHCQYTACYLLKLIIIKLLLITHNHILLSNIFILPTQYFIIHFRIIVIAL